MDHAEATRILDLVRTGDAEHIAHTTIRRALTVTGDLQCTFRAHTAPQPAVSASLRPVDVPAPAFQLRCNRSHGFNRLPDQKPTTVDENSANWG